MNRVSYTCLNCGAEYTIEQIGPAQPGECAACGTMIEPQMALDPERKTEEGADPMHPQRPGGPWKGGHGHGMYDLGRKKE